MDLVLPTPKVDRQAPKGDEELEPCVTYVARLKIEVLQAAGILPCRHPYIICRYDHDERVVMVKQVPTPSEVYFDRGQMRTRVVTWDTSWYL
jgi:hypothetical protein